MVGAGLVGLEVAEALVDRGVKVTVLELMDSLPACWIGSAPLATKADGGGFPSRDPGGGVRGGRVLARCAPGGFLPRQLALVSVGCSQRAARRRRG